MSARPTRQSAQQTFSALGRSQAESQCSQQLRLRALTRLYFIRTFQPFGPAGARINFPFQCAAVRKMSSSVTGLQLCVKCLHIAWVRTRPAVLVQHTVSKPAQMQCWFEKVYSARQLHLLLYLYKYKKHQILPPWPTQCLFIATVSGFNITLISAQICPYCDTLWKSLLSLLTKTRFSNYMWWGRSILWHHSCAIGKTFGAILKLERKGFQGAKIFPSLYFSKGLKFFEESERKLFYLIYFQSDPCTIWETFFCQQLWQVWS